MKVTVRRAKQAGIRISVREGGRELGRAYLYILWNDLHEKPFGFMEDVFVDEASRGKGIGSRLVNEVIRLAKARGCYKLIATSRHARPAVHELYRRLGFGEQGVEFRIDF